MSRFCKAATFWLALFVCVFANTNTQAQRIELSPIEDDGWRPLPVGSSLETIATRAKAAPTIDGKLDEPLWANASSAISLAQLGGVDESAAKWVKLHTAYDEKHLYIAGTLSNPGQPLKALITEIGGRVWKDDSLELFFFDSESSSIYQLDANANGAWWAGKRGATGKWAPSPTVAATKTATGWTVEIAIPFADLPFAESGNAALPMQARYLVRDQGGFVAWGPGQKQSQAGLICFTPEQSSAQTMRATAVHFPSELPEAGGRVGYEFHNPTDKPRLASVRIAKEGVANWSLTNREEIKPGETKRVAINLAPEADTKYVLLGMDGVQGRWTLREARYIEARPDFQLRMLRERFWFGEKQIEAQLALGVPDDELEQTNLSLAFYSETHRLEQTKPIVMTTNSYDLKINVQDLAAGNYKLIVKRESPTGTKSNTYDLALQQSLPLPDKRSIALKVNWPDAGGDIAPVYCGLPLPGGMLKDASHIRLVDNEGNEVPVQVDPLATWSPAGSIRWVGLRFTAERDRTYAVELGSSIKRAAVANAIKVSETNDAITVDTGSAKWELPKRGPLVGKAWINGKQVLSGDQPVLVVTDQNGRSADETRNSADEQPTIELAGPNHVIIKRQGLYRTAAGERLGKYIARISFDRSSAVAKLQHTFIVTEEADKVQYADIAVSVSPAFAGSWQVAMAHDKGVHKTTMDAATGGAYLSQLVYPHFYKTDSKFAIAQKQGSTWNQSLQGDVAGNWLAAQSSDAAVGVAVAIRDLAKLFPKELEASNSKVTAHLWSSRGGRLLDYRPASLIEHWGEDWCATYPNGGIEGLKKVQASPIGSARTHEVTIALLGNNAIQTASDQAEQLDNPVLAIVDPYWLRLTEALGPVHPYDPDQFPKIESFHRKVFDELFVKQIEHCGDYGYLDYGNGPHTMTVTRTDTPGKGRKPRLGYRYTSSEYHGRTAMWLAYARSGDRLYYDYAVPFTRHLSDFRFNWFANSVNKLGAILGGGGSEDTPIYWTGWTAHDKHGMYAGHQGIDLANFYMQYFLTGDQRALDGPTVFAERIIEDFDPMRLPNVGGTSSACMALALPAQLYFHTWDERIGRKLYVARQRAIDLRTSSGLAQQDYFGARYKSHVRHWGTLEDWKVTGAKRSQDALLRYAPHLLDGVPSPDLGYQDHSATYANFAAQWTGDKSYASWVKARIETTVAAFTDEQGNLTNAPYRGPWNFNFPQVIAYGLDLMARDSEHIKTMPELETMYISERQPVYLKKKWGQDIHMDLNVETDWDMRLAKTDEKFESWRGSYYVAPLEINAQQGTYSRAADGLADAHASLHLPPDMLPGEYELTGVENIVTTDANQLVTVVRDGVYLQGEKLQPDNWYFQLPGGTSGAVFISRNTASTMNDEQRILTGGKWHEFANESAQPLTVSLAISDVTYLRFAGGIPAVLAAHDPTRYFIPQSTNVMPIELKETPPRGDVFVTGRTDKANDKAVQLTASKRLMVPLGDRVAKDKWQRIDWQRGTLEFWYRPNWSSDLQTEPILLPIVAGNVLPFSMEYHHSIPQRVDSRTLFFNMAALKFFSRGEPNSWYGLNLVNATQFKQSRWVHIAICWDTEPNGRGWIAEMYRDGKGTSGESRKRNVSGPYHVNQFERSFKQYFPKAVEEGNVKGMLWFNGSLEGSIDDLRISNVVRYPKPFDVSRIERFEEDEHTLLLLPFDGELKASVPRDDKDADAHWR